jgi:hypothetical protein
MPVSSGGGSSALDALLSSFTNANGLSASSTGAASTAQSDSNSALSLLPGPHSKFANVNNSINSASHSLSHNPFGITRSAAYPLPTTSKSLHRHSLPTSFADDAKPKAKAKPQKCPELDKFLAKLQAIDDRAEREEEFISN